MRWSNLCALVLTLELVSTQQYDVTLKTFEDELRSPYHGVPLYCQVYPLPEEPLYYHWAASVFDVDLLYTDTSPYADYQVLFNHPRFGRAFCYVETSQRFIGREEIRLEAQGYIEAARSTTVDLQPGEPLELRTKISRQYSTDSESPLLNVRILTEWTHNGLPVNQPLVQGGLSLLIDSTQEADAGLYELRVLHFFIIGYTYSTEQVERMCSRIIIDVLGLYAIFSPVQFQVNIGTNGLIPAPEKTARHYQFFEGKQLDVSIQVPLQQIQDIDYRQPPDNNFVLSYMIRLHGKVLIDTTQRIDVPDPMIFSQFRLINHNTAQVDITLPSPGRSAEGLYEYQFYLSSLGVQALLTITECDESYKNFLTGGIRLPFYLVGETTIFITMANQLAVNASQSYLTTEDTDGITLSCKLAQPNSIALELSWFKNGFQVATTNTSSILYLSTVDVVRRQDTANVHGTYTCSVTETNGQRSTTYFHIPEKVFFSLQLRHKNDLDCASTITTEAIKTAALDELMTIFTHTCYCDITPDQITMETLSCDGNVLTVSSEFIFSDEDGIMTASDLLSSAASVLMGERLFDDITLAWDTSCPLKDAQGNCIEGRKRAENQLTALAVALLTGLALAIVGIVLTVLILCALRCRRESKQSVSTSPQLPTPPHSHRPATSPEVSNDPQSYSYPHVPSNAGRRALSLPTLANPHTNTHSNNTGNVNTRVGNRENGTTQNYSPEPATESSPICIPNPAYTVTNKDGLNNSLASQSESIRVNKWELPSEGATGQRHEYDYPLFKEQEQDTSWDGSDYI